jgi:methyltransferase (TIGR00027 family)
MAVAMRRAAHQLIDRPIILEDPVALAIIGPEAKARIDLGQAAWMRFSRFLRAFVVARAKFVEEILAPQRAAGLRQMVVLGAGLDTFAYRDPSPELPLRIWEIDHPATQAWKRERLAAGKIAVPANVTFVPVDFERDRLGDSLAAARFDAQAGALFSWLGVVPYLTHDAIAATLSYIASATRTRGGVAFDYFLARSELTLVERFFFWSLQRKLKRIGEPFQAGFVPAELRRLLLSLGFASVTDLAQDAINARWFGGRSDRLRVGRVGRIAWAGEPIAIR